MSLDGLLVVDKPAGHTSHDVVARCRRLLSQKRVGHGGTLDPDATGVLVVAVGRVTRLLRFLTPLPKTYVGELVLGTATDTLDASGQITGTWEMSAVTPAEVTAAARALTGDILQVPPMVSAIQVGGRRLHELARKGIEVERQPRPVRVDRFDVTALVAADHRYRFLVECSSGTYVRSLVDDLGRALGGGAHLASLRRTAVGPFGESQAVGLDQVGPDRLLTPLAAVAHLPLIELSQECLTLARHGRPLGAAAAAGVAGTGPWAATDPDGELVGVYEAGAGGVIRPAVILRPA